MIRFTLHCDKDHSFDSWFASDTGFVALKSAGQVACPVCGSKSVEKSLMAPNVRPARNAEARALQPGAAAPPSLSTPMSDAEIALSKLRAEIEAKSDYVGLNFAGEARKMHAGDIPERAIHGEARWDEAKALLEDGVPIAPLPFLPKARTN